MPDSLIGVTHSDFEALRDIVRTYESYGPNRRYGDGTTVAERLLAIARQVTRAGVDDATAFGDSFKLELIEKWTREHRMDLATRLGTMLREGTPIRTAVDEVHKVSRVINSRSK